MERGIVELLESAAAKPTEVTHFGHGTTVATNALIEGRTALTALVTTAGFRDILEIRQQRQPHNYNIRIPKPVSPVPRHLCREVGERTFQWAATTSRRNKASFTLTSPTSRPPAWPQSRLSFSTATETRHTRRR